MTELASWVARERVEEDVLTLFPARGMAALLDRPSEPFSEGARLPAGWHWLYFRPLPRRSELGPDGHERRGAFLPPVPLPRRMWAGGRLELPGELRLGERVTRRSTVESVREKEGRSGRLAFVTVRHRVEGPRGLAVDEEQHLVYRDGSGGGRPWGTERASADADWSETFLADPVTLFRFSALTFNGHRIHYDHPYATAHEGYPALVVHAPLTALLLLDAVCRHGGGTPRSFSYRASSPLFAGEEIRLEGRRAGDGSDVVAWAAAPDGAVAMRCEAVWGEGIAPSGAAMADPPLPEAGR